MARGEGSEQKKTLRCTTSTIGCLFPPPLQRVALNTREPPSHGRRKERGKGRERRESQIDDSKTKAFCFEGRRSPEITSPFISGCTIPFFLLYIHSYSTPTRPPFPDSPSSYRLSKNSISRPRGSFAARRRPSRRRPRAQRRRRRRCRACPCDRRRRRRRTRLEKRKKGGDAMQGMSLLFKFTDYQQVYTSPRWWWITHSPTRAGPSARVNTRNAIIGRVCIATVFCVLGRHLL